MDIIQINESFFTDAIEKVAAVRAINLTPSPTETGNVIRSYVDLGINYKIEDYSSALPDDQKDTIIEAVGDEADTKYATVRVDLEILENLYLAGQINPLIARPREGQERFLESKATETPAPSIIGNAANQIGDFLKVVLEGFLKGLGIDIPLGTIIIIAIVFITFIYYRKVAK